MFIQFYLVTEFQKRQQSAMSSTKMRVSERLNNHIYCLVISLLCCGLKICLPPESLFGNMYIYIKPSSSFFFIPVLLRYNSHNIKFTNFNIQNTTISTSNLKTFLSPTKEIPNLLEITLLILSPLILRKYKSNLCLYECAYSQHFI